VSVRGYRRLCIPLACRGEGACPACTGDALEDAILARDGDRAAFIASRWAVPSTGAAVPGPATGPGCGKICDGTMSSGSPTRSSRRGPHRHLVGAEPYGAVPDLLTMGRDHGGLCPLSALHSRPGFADVLPGGGRAAYAAKTFSQSSGAVRSRTGRGRVPEEHQLVASLPPDGRPPAPEARGLREHPLVGDVRGADSWPASSCGRTGEPGPFPRSARLTERLVTWDGRRTIVWPTRPRRWHQRDLIHGRPTVRGWTRGRAGRDIPASLAALLTTARLTN